MTKLLEKEIRLLLPSYLAALALAVLPVWLLPASFHEIFIGPLWFGIALLSLSSFGREFGLKTFSLMLTQPLDRGRVWWAKVSVLGIALLTIFDVWCIARAANLDLSTESIDFRHSMVIWIVMVVVTAAGALWSTLLFRQMIAALWFTLLIPGALVLAIGGLEGGEKTVFVAMAIYVGAGSYAAWRLWWKVKDAEWTGGDINFSLGKAESSRTVSRRQNRPITALIRKELRLQQFTLAGIPLLLVLHLAAVAVRKYGMHAAGDSFLFQAAQSSKLFGGIWLIVPLIASGPCLAEERKLGIIQEILCFPVSWRIQFLIKLLLVLFIGGIVCPFMLTFVEGIAGMVGADAGIETLKTPFDFSTLWEVPTLFIAISLAGFYASTLVKNILQALGAGVVTAISILIIQFFLFVSVPITGLSRLIQEMPDPLWLWNGRIGIYIGWPVLAVTIVWLAYRNSKSGVQDLRFWRGNLLKLVSALLLIVGVTSLIFNRAWEFLIPLESAHGPARLVGPGKLDLKVFRSTLTARLPSNQLWVDRIVYNKGKSILGASEDTGIRVGGKWMSLSEGQILAGTNWTDAVANFQETVAIQGDGSLWVSEKPRYARIDDNVIPPVERDSQLIRFGNETNWVEVLAETSHSVMLLKRNGSLWRWGNPNFDYKQKWKGLRNLEPELISDARDWAKLASGSGCIHAWKTDGLAWVIYPLSEIVTNRDDSIRNQLTMERIPLFDHLEWHSVTSFMDRGFVAVRQDGTLWVWATSDQKAPSVWWGLPQNLQQMGLETNWVSIAGWGRELIGLKQDGSLWKWEFSSAEHFDTLSLAKVPTRLGSHSDWVGIGEGICGVYALSGDGTLWCWWYQDAFYNSVSYSQPLLRAPRRPSKIENIFAARQTAGRE